MIPRTIIARPEELSSRMEPDILPLPGRASEAERQRGFSNPPFAGARARIEAPDVGPKDILNALRYHSVLFVTLGTIVAGGLFVTAWLLVPAKYTTYATLFVDQRIPTVMPL